MRVEWKNSYGPRGGGLCACVDFKRSNMSFSSSIQACLEFASAFRTSSGFATESRGGLFPRMIVALFVASGLPLPRVLSALAHPGKRPGRRGPMPGTLPTKRPRKDPDEEPTVE